MAVNPLDVYSIVAHPDLSAEDKRAKIDALYGVAPDLRMASTTGDDRTAINAALADPSLSAPAAAPSVADVGGRMSMPIAPAPVAAAPRDATPVIDPRTVGAVQQSMPVISGADVPNLAAAATSHPASVSHAPISHAPAAPEVPHDVTPEAPADEDLLTAGVSALVGGALRGTPAHRVAAHDQPTASVVERAGGVPDEIKERVAKDAEAEAGLALEEGDAQSKAHLDAAIAADNQAHGARADLAALQQKQKDAEAHIQKLDTDFEQMTKDTAIKPSDWWSSKSTAGKVTSLLGAIMFGLAGDPQGLQRVIEEDLALKAQNREKKLGAFKMRIDDFRSRLMSPEAANAAERSLAAQAVAAEATRFAEAAAAPEARVRAQQVAQHFQTLSDQHAEEMAMREAGTVRTNIMHVPERVAGGAPDPLTVLKRAKELGLSPEETIKVLMGGKYGAASPEEAKTRVILPGGEVGYTSEDLHKETQTQMDALQGLQSNLARIKALTSRAGHSIAGQDKARLQALIADTTTQLSGMARGEGANARMAGEMLDILKPLTGAGALDTTTADATTRAGIDEASRLYEAHVQGIKNRLTPSPKTSPSGGKIKTLGSAAAKEAVGFEHE